ncbi:MAG: response regulator, partial [Terriglobales bacterium]
PGANHGSAGNGGFNAPPPGDAYNGMPPNPADAYGTPPPPAQGDPNGAAPPPPAQGNPSGGTPPPAGDAYYGSTPNP